MNHMDATALEENVEQALNHTLSGLLLNPILMNGHQPLDDQDYATVLDGRQLLQRAYVALDHALGQCCSLVDVLSIKKNQVQQMLDRSLILTSPVRQLPIELLQTIFGSVDSAPSFEHHPPVVAAVCRYWRDIALMMPALWTRLYIPCDVGRRPEMEERLALWEERTKNHPLALIIEAPPRNRCLGKPSDTVEKDSVAQAEHAGTTLAEALEPFAGRLEYLRLESNSPAMFFLLSKWKSLQGLSFPALRTLVIARTLQVHFCNIRSSPLVSALCNKCTHVTSLLINSPLDKNLAPLPDTLQTFYGSILDMSVLSSASSLQVVHLSGFPSWWKFRLAESSSLQNLTSVSLFCELPSPSVHLPRLPALRHLIVGIGGQQGLLPLAGILTAWGPQLRFLAVLEDTSQRITGTHLAEYLAFCPNLDVLRLTIELLWKTTELTHIPLPECVEFGDIYAQWLKPSVVLRRVARALEGEGWGPRLKTLRTINLSVDMRTAPSVEHTREILHEMGVTVTLTSYRRLYAFVGPFFEAEGGIFEDMYSLDGWDYPDVPFQQ